MLTVDKIIIDYQFAANDPHTLIATAKVDAEIKIGLALDILVTMSGTVERNLRIRAWDALYADVLAKINETQHAVQKVAALTGPGCDWQAIDNAFAELRRLVRFPG